MIEDKVQRPTTVTLYMDRQLNDRLQSLATNRRTSKSATANWCIEKWLDHLEDLPRPQRESA